MTAFRLRESVRSVMREIDADAQRYLQRGRDLSPQAGAIAVGGAHFDEFVRGEALGAFLRALRKGADPSAAVDVAKVYARECVATWNRQRGRDYVVHRWEGATDLLIERAGRLVRDAAGTMAEQGALFA